MILKVKILQTADNQKEFKSKNFVLNLLIYIYLQCVRRSSRSPTTLDTLVLVFTLAHLQCNLVTRNNPVDKVGNVGILF